MGITVTNEWRRVEKERGWASFKEGDLREGGGQLAILCRLFLCRRGSSTIFSFHIVPFRGFPICLSKQRPRVKNRKMDPETWVWVLRYILSVPI